MTISCKILKLAFLSLFLIGFSNVSANEVERTRNLANSKPFIEENKTASDLAQDFLLDAGVTDGLIRMNVGIESINDLQKEFKEALV